MLKYGQEITLEELEEIMRKHDGSGDGAIQFDEFKRMMFDDEEEKEDKA